MSKTYYIVKKFSINVVIGLFGMLLFVQAAWREITKLRMLLAFRYKAHFPYTMTLSTISS
jgi:hypothetical protein